MFSLLVMTTLLGASSFGCGMLPLSFVFSKTHLSQLTTLGSGLLLGTALGVIIPEGIEALADAHPSFEISAPRVALSLLCGFTFMLIVEQLFSLHSHSPASATKPTANVKPTNSEVQFDAELGELEGEQGMARSTVDWVAPVQAESSAQIQAIPLTLGLVIHSLADGFALGVSFFPSNESKSSSSLSAIVFLAIIIHKLPTSLALTSSLLATSLSRPQCKKHLAVFSVSTPIAALLSYVALDFFGGAEHADWPGTALLLSGGTFLNVATLVSHRSDANPSEMSERTRLTLTVLGIFVPFLLSSLLGHGH
ncbi:Zinc/iron permease [Lentinula aff. lateritia]|uniref:Zinc/iron permease n=1 Tax=Lentinula aff. lateritia TaxID=2804960 RepID=A0ACC1UBL3_9AGAR|nr:Zinc/iron permease [Lentinula aff. lateritia]